MLTVKLTCPNILVKCLYFDYSKKSNSLSKIVSSGSKFSKVLFLRHMMIFPTESGPQGRNHVIFWPFYIQQKPRESVKFFNPRSRVSIVHSLVNVKNKTEIDFFFSSNQISAQKCRFFFVKLFCWSKTWQLEVTCLQLLNFIQKISSDHTHGLSQQNLQASLSLLKFCLDNDARICKKKIQMIVH